MTISKETIETRKEIDTMKKNLDALAGAVQQCDLFLKEFEDKTPTIKESMPAAKQEALNMAIK